MIFVTTANTLDTIPGPLRDRMEVIQLAGYTEAEKLEIAKRYLVPRQIERNGLTSRRIAFTDPALRAIIADYTREAGVRQLEREIGTVCRKVARQVAEGKRDPQGHGHRAARPRAARQAQVLLRGAGGGPRGPGVATGLAWTPVGGEVLFIEATAMPGAGGLTITGQLGDVMRESAQAALSYVRANARELRAGPARRLVRRRTTSTSTCPPGAIPKDGPSAGVAMVTALASLLSGRPVRVRRGDDRRGHADRAGAADRRAQGEGAGRAAQRDPAR